MSSESIKKFDNYLKKKIVEINKDLKEFGNIDEYEKTAELSRYKSLLFTKHRLSYFIRCIEDDNCLDGDELFTSFRPLSDVIVESPLEDNEKIDVVYFYARLNDKIGTNFDQKFYPSVESIYDEYNVLMDLSLGEIHHLCVKKSLLSLVKENGRAARKYEEQCEKIDHSFEYNAKMLINYSEEALENLNSSKASSIITCLSGVGFKDNIVMDLFFNFLFDYLYDNRKYEDPVACYLYCAKTFIKYATDRDAVFQYKRADDLCEGALKCGPDVSKKQLVMIDELVQYLIERGKEKNIELPLKLEKCQKPLK